MAQPLLTEMPTPRQAFELVGGPLIAGAITGYLLGTTWWLYLAMVLLSIIGGLPAAQQHRSILGALARGAWSGLLWGLAVLGVNAATGATPVLALPEPHIVFLAFTIIPTMIFAAVSFYVGQRRSAKHPVSEPEVVRT